MVHSGTSVCRDFMIISYRWACCGKCTHSSLSKHQPHKQSRHQFLYRWIYIHWLKQIRSSYIHQPNVELLSSWLCRLADVHLPASLLQRRPIAAGLRARTESEQRRARPLHRYPPGEWSAAIMQTPAAGFVETLSEQTSIKIILSAVYLFIFIASYF